jgi:hypothetical protein
MPVCALVSRLAITRAEVNSVRHPQTISAGASRLWPRKTTGLGRNNVCICCTLEVALLVGFVIGGFFFVWLFIPCKSKAKPRELMKILNFWFAYLSFISSIAERCLCLLSHRR